MNRKEPSNLSITDNTGRFTLPKAKILRGKNNFQRLFSDSSQIHTSTISLRYIPFKDAGEGLKIGFIAPKKIGNAVQRNRCKRLLREAYRLNKYALENTLNSLNIGLHAAFIAKRRNFDFDMANNQIKYLINELNKRLLKHEYSLNT